MSEMAFSLVPFAGILSDLRGRRYACAEYMCHVRANLALLFRAIPLFDAPSQSCDL